MALYPLLLQPTLHIKVWGGRRLGSVLNKALPTGEPYGESWELHDTSTVANGPHAGQTLGDLLGQYGTDLVGAGNDPAEGFPLLAKFIDATRWLSVQVHPDDDQARALEGDPRGKTEAWHILSATSNAQLVIGVHPGTNRDDIARAIRENILEDLLVYADVKAGDTLYLAANTIHAIGPGILLYEIQQSSDVTYRLYDWGRMGLDGKPRPLHIDKGVRVCNTGALPEISHPDRDDHTVTLVDGDYFKTVAHQPGGETLALETDGRFHALSCTGGSVTITAGDARVTLDTGQTALIPASLGAYELAGPGRALRSWQAE